MPTSEKRRLFDSILRRLIGELPDHLRQHLEEVPIIVEDEPEDESDGKSDLCGQHWGTPLTERSVTESRLDPDRILIFRGPILRLSGRSRRTLETQIRITLLHELGHHFGFTEEDLDALGYG